MEMMTTVACLDLQVRDLFSNRSGFSVAKLSLFNPTDSSLIWRLQVVTRTFLDQISLKEMRDSIYPHEAESLAKTCFCFYSIFKKGK